LDDRPAFDVVRPQSHAETGKRWQRFQTLGTFPFGCTFSLAMLLSSRRRDRFTTTSRILKEEISMDGIIYLVGLIVVVMFILSLFGLR
jgi:hypothetical protein